MTDIKSKFTIASLESYLDFYLRGKLPGMPENAKAFLVKAIPWIDLVMIILVLPLALLALGLTALVDSFSFFGAMQTSARIAVSPGWDAVFYIFLFVPLVLQAIALPGLFKKSASGWRFSFYAVLVDAVGYVIALNFNSLIGVAISLYLLFQIRSYYSGLPAIAPITINPPPSPNLPPPPSPQLPPPAAPMPPAQ